MTLPKSLINGLFLHIPKSLEGVAPVSPNREEFFYEAAAWLGLEAVLRPASIAYDCGAAHGLMSAMMAQRVTEGEVHAFEANREVLLLTEELLAANGGRVALNHCCVGERSGLEVEFYRAGVASSRHAAVAASHPGAPVDRVRVFALDDYAAECGHVPDVIKLDIEGSEWVALDGAAGILKQRPDLVIETHAAQMTGEGASIGALCGRLESLGYPLFDLQGGKLMEGAEFAAAYPFLPGQLLASERLGAEGFVERLCARHKEIGERQRMVVRHREAIADMRRLLDRDAGDAVRIGEGILAEAPAHGEANYLVGLGLQLQDREWERAVRHYELALEGGFDPYWVNYNLNALKSKTPSG